MPVGHSDLGGLLTARPAPTKISPGKRYQGGNVWPFFENLKAPLHAVYYALKGIYKNPDKRAKYIFWKLITEFAAFSH